MFHIYFCITYEWFFYHIYIYIFRFLIRIQIRILVADVVNEMKLYLRYVEHLEHDRRRAAPSPWNGLPQKREHWRGVDTAVNVGGRFRTGWRPALAQKSRPDATGVNETRWQCLPIDTKNGYGIRTLPLEKQGEKKIWERTQGEKYCRKSRANTERSDGRRKNARRRRCARRLAGKYPFSKVGATAALAAAAAFGPAVAQAPARRYLSSRAPPRPRAPPWHGRFFSARARPDSEG